MYAQVSDSSFASLSSPFIFSLKNSMPIRSLNDYDLVFTRYPGMPKSRGEGIWQAWQYIWQNMTRLDLSYLGTLRRWVIPKSGNTVLFWEMGRTPFLTHVASHEQDDLRLDA